MITLPDRNSIQGLEARVFLGECASPADKNYTLKDAIESMKLMDVVLRNRMKDPKPFLAKGVTMKAVVTARGQFAGFEHYPSYSNAIAHNIQKAIDVANNSKDPRHADYAAFVNAAITIAKSAPQQDPSPGALVGWRTANTGAPGKGFIVYKTVLGNTFYYQ